MTTIFAIILMIAILISFSLMAILITALKRQRRTEKVTTRFAEAAAKHRLYFPRKDWIKGQLIGLDPSKQLLLIAAQGKEELIDLTRMDTAVVKHEYGFVWKGYSRRNGAAMHVVATYLQLKREGEVVHSIPFYDINADGTTPQPEREAMAKDWQVLIEACLQNGRSFKHQGKNGSKTLRA